jgi:hypothetical protein
MRKLLVKMILSSITAVLVSGTLVAQVLNTDTSSPAKPEKSKLSQAKPKPSELESMLAEALVNNPDIRVAEAKLREAEAELNRVRFQVLQKVTTLHHGLEAQKAVVKAAEERLQLMLQLRRQARISEVEVQPVESQLGQEKAKVAALEAELPSLLGRLPQRSSADKTGADTSPYLNNLGSIPYLGSIPPSSITPGMGRNFIGWTEYVRPTNVEPAQGAMADKIRKALDALVTLDIQDKPLNEALKVIQVRTPGILFHTVLPGEQMARMKVNLHVEQLPLGAALQALEDSFPEMRDQDFGGRGALRFAVREYGILVTTQGALPPGAILLHDFWKGHTGKGSASGISTSDQSAERRRPPENLEGTIKATDRQTGTVTVSIGSDAGLRKGHTLEVYRLKPNPTYLGTIQILDVRPTEAVAKPPTGGSRAVIEVGDQVTSSIHRR